MIADKVTFCIFDGIISETATILPAARLIALARKHNIKIMIDGAHCIGQIPVDLKSLDPDFYCSNLHKWLCADKGCAFLYVKKEHQKVIRPLTISHGYPGGFQSEFLWCATNDYGSFLSLTAALNFYKGVGPEKIAERNHDLVIKAARHCAQVWKTQLLCKEELYASMVTIELPPIKDIEVSGGGAFKLKLFLLEKYNVMGQFIFIRGKLYIRISAQLYNEMSDYERIAEIIQLIRSD
eukprot:TRINITY_DN7218_c0_g1_i4.p1 TRINITY_DN7218_c0_g1~~TRINITY_DN7218_c0_g1_i4.p1  ORF type:complete len:238 (-),score=69.83 TRINITY_DN7218_c0_g1_i4:170-883(-)